MENWTFEALGLFIILAQGLLIWITWSMKRQFVSREQFEESIDALAERLNAAEVRAAEMEAEMNHFPNSERLFALSKNIEELRGEIKAQSAENRGLRDSLNQVQRSLDILQKYHVFRTGSANP